MSDVRTNGKTEWVIINARISDYYAKHKAVSMPRCGMPQPRPRPRPRLNVLISKNFDRTRLHWGTAPALARMILTATMQWQPSDVGRFFPIMSYLYARVQQIEWSIHSAWHCIVQNALCGFTAHQTEMNAIESHTAMITSPRHSSSAIWTLDNFHEFKAYLCAVDEFVWPAMPFRLALSSESFCHVCNCAMNNNQTLWLIIILKSPTPFIRFVKNRVLARQPEQQW